MNKRKLFEKFWVQSSFSEVNSESDRKTYSKKEILSDGFKKWIIWKLWVKTSFSEVNNSNENAVIHEENKSNSNTSNLSIKEQIQSIWEESLFLIGEIAEKLPEKLQAYMMTNMSLSDEINNWLKLIENIRPWFWAKVKVWFANLLPQWDLKNNVVNNYTNSLQTKLTSTLTQLVNITKARDLLFEKNLIDEKDYINFLKIKDNLNSDLLKLDELTPSISDTDDLLLKQELNYKKSLLTNSILPIESSLLDVINEMYSNKDRLNKLEVILKTAPIVLNSIIKKESNNLLNKAIDREINSWSNTLQHIIENDAEVSVILSNKDENNIEVRILSLLTSRLESMKNEVIESNKHMDEKQKEILDWIKKVDSTILAFESMTWTIIWAKSA